MTTYTDAHATIYEITLPDNTVYSIKDQVARQRLADLEGITGALLWKGVTTTELEDGATTAVVTIGTDSITAEAGDVVLYGKKEFVFDGARWQELGDLSDLAALIGQLGDMAYVDSVSTTYTPEGTVSGGFEGTEISLAASYIPSGSITVDAYTPEGTIAIDSYTPHGTVAAPEITVTPTTDTFSQITDAGTLPSATMPTLSTSVQNENLTFSWTAGTFDAGALPTMSGVTVATGISSATATAPAFTGSSATLTGGFTGSAKAPTGTFTGAAGVASSTFTPAGSLTGLAFSGSTATISMTAPAHA